MLEEEAADVEVSLWKHYGIDLRDLWRPNGGKSQLTMRRLRALLRFLPYG